MTKPYLKTFTQKKGKVNKRKPDSEKLTKDLKAKAVRIFNEWIRERDKDLPCISSGRRGVNQAGHYFSSGKYPALQFNEDNVNAQSLSDNYFKSGNLLEYRKNLEKKIGTERLLKLEQLAAYWKGKPHHANRFFYLEIITNYSAKIKEIKREREIEFGKKISEL